MTEYNFSVKQGTTFNGARFTVTLNDSPVDLTGASIQASFRKDQKTPAAMRLSVGAGLTISDAAAGQFWIDAQEFLASPGTYKYEIEITLASGVIKSWIRGTAIITENLNRER